MIRHNLKLWREHFDAVLSGLKRADVRGEEDRRFEVGDEINFYLVAGLADPSGLPVGEPIRDGDPSWPAKYPRQLLFIVRHIDRHAGPLTLFGVKLSDEATPGQLAKVAVLSFSLKEGA